MNECICEGNWRKLVSEYESLIGSHFIEDSTGNDYIFFGLVHGSEDYYYGMCRKDGESRLLSCVGSIEGFGFTKVG